MGRKPRQPQALTAAERCSVTGVLASRPDSRDFHLTGFSISLYGKDLVKDTELKLNHGRRYGLIGQNGSGKTTLLSAIGSGELPIPAHVSIWHLKEEAPPLSKTALSAVTDAASAEAEKLEEELFEIAMNGDGDEVMESLCERLDRLDVETLVSRAGSLLRGLGFSRALMQRETRDLSGGWRMRVALAQALLAAPDVLLLDEPTNHLDLEACVWLERHLAAIGGTLVVVSHSQDFLNGVCTNVIELTQNATLEYYTGNYDSYVQTRGEIRSNQAKRHKKERDDIARLQKFIRSCGTYSNLVKQAQSKQKIIDKLVEGGLTPAPSLDPVYSFRFPVCEKLPPPILSINSMSFSYPGSSELYTDIDGGVDLDSRVALVGPNGCGKSTLLKLMRGDLQPTSGYISRHGRLRIASYSQHSEEQLDLRKSPIKFLQEQFPDGVVTKYSNGAKVRPEVEQWRQILGSFGITGRRQTDPMSALSDGLKSRVTFCLLGLQNPHLLLLDEPTNHLDMDCINSLAAAIKSFEGGLVLVSHDFRLLSQVADEIWVCDDQKIKKWDDPGGIRSYKASLIKEKLTPK